MISLLAAVNAITGCIHDWDPSLGAEGQVSLADDLVAENVTALEIVAHEVEDLERRHSVRIEDPQLPREYSVGHVIDASSEQNWRVIAWLSTSSEPASAPAPGEMFGTRDFELVECGNKGFCGVITGVDVVIDGVFNE